MDMAKGKLDTLAPPLNSFVSPFKQLQADLKHMTWQIHQISEGDLEQKVSFSGDFSESINKMIETLREKQRISELNEKLLAELMELNVSKDKLFSIIAHDLKNPFSGLINLSDMVLSDVRAGRFDDVEECAVLLKTFSLQGYKLLINLLDWAKVQSNTILINLEPVQLNELVELSKALVEPVAILKNITIESNFQEKEYIVADSNMLQTVLRNLLSNAVKFTKAGGRVAVSAERVGDKLKISVQDNGVGIRPDNLKLLFRLESPFSTNGTENEFGSGLGLILSRDFLKKMNSEIAIESQVGIGSTFSFLLPLA
jgi:signal transduction histidine kinase